MSSSTLRIIAIFLAVGALLLGYVGYQAGQQPVADASSQIQQPAPEPERFPLLIAARDIPADHPIQAADVTTIFNDSQPADSYHEIAQVSGQTTRLPIAAGDLILSDHFSQLSPLVASIRPGERAIAVRVDEVTGAGGFIEPGDRVDVLFFLASGREAGNDSSAQRILRDVRVLAYGNSVESINRKAIAQKAKLNKPAEAKGSPETQTSTDDDEPSGKKSKTAVLAVADKDLSSLLLAESSGRLRLALIGDESNDAAGQQINNTANSTTIRQLVTLDQFKPGGQESVPSLQPRTAPKRVIRPSAPPRANVTVIRGTQTSTVSVNREN